jgi:hypothetical protein
VKRRFFNLVAALSLLLFAAVLLLWARSHFGDTLLVNCSSSFESAM